MTTAYAPPSRGNLTPAFLAALVLHLGVFAAVVLLASRPPTIPIGSAVPINIVSSAPATDSRPADVAPQTRVGQAETPAPTAPPPVPAAAPPRPAPPAPAPPKAKPMPKPTPAPAKPVPVAKPQPPRPAFDLDALQASIVKASRTTPARPAFAARRGPTRAETAPRARVDAGAAVSQSSMQGIQQLLQRLWNPNCNVEGGDAVIVPVRFSVGGDGRVVGRVGAGGEEASGAPVVAAAARRAIDAVREAEPYGPEYRGAAFKVIFDARKACAQ